MKKEDMEYLGQEDVEESFHDNQLSEWMKIILPRKTEPTEAQTSIDQPPPIKNDKPAIWLMVIEDAKDDAALVADMLERHEVGVKRYGVPLQPFNGRNALLDAYAESLDLTVYLRQELVEHPENASDVLRLYENALDLAKSLKRLTSQKK